MNIYSIPTYLGNNDEVFRLILEGLILLMFMKAASIWLLLEALKKKVLINRDSSK